MIALGKVITECEVYEFSRSRIGKLVKKTSWLQSKQVLYETTCGEVKPWVFFQKYFFRKKKQKDPVIS